MARLLNIHALTHINNPMVLLPLEEYASLLNKASRKTDAQTSFNAPKKLLKLLSTIRRSKGRTFSSAKKLREHLNNL